jgi:hypothetical protein
MVIERIYVGIQPNSPHFSMVIEIKKIALLRYADKEGLGTDPHVLHKYIKIL